MNMEKELRKKEKELKIIKDILTETLIISQLKYLTYLNEQRKLEQEIEQLKEIINKPKIIKTWIDVEGGWKKRVYKNE